MEFNIFIAIFVFLFGLAIGSFLNVLIYRIPKNLNILYPPSACPKCNNKLRWYHNIPLFSWLILRGKCAYCNNKISFQYPFVELFNALIWLAIYYQYGLSWDKIFVMLSFSMLLALSMIDIKYFAIPDSLNYAALVFALINPNFLLALKNALIGGFGLFLIGYFTSKVAKKDALGEGDIIVAATMAALLGFPAFFIALFIAAVIAIIPSLMAKDTMVPFVPFLALGTLVTYLFKEELLFFIKVIMYG